MNRIGRILSDRNLSVFSIIIYLVSLILPIWVGFHNYATGDDLLYGSVVHNLMKEHASLGSIISAVYQDVVTEWNQFQGTWASGTLWRLEPSIWGERAYYCTVFISVIMLSAGVSYFLTVLVHRCMGLSRSVTLIIISWTAFFSMQYMPYPRGGLYWYTGMVQYTFAYGVAMFTLGWAFMYHRTGQLRYLVGLIVATSYMGGAGYPEVVITGLGLFGICLWGILSLEADRRKRAWILVIPMILVAAGFLLSAAAPGNSIRGGEDYGFSMSRVAEVFTGSFVSGVSDFFRYFMEVRPLIFLPVGIFIICVGCGTEERISLRTLITVAVSGFIMVCMIHAPEIYAGSTVTAGISGGVYNSYFFISVLWISVMAAMLGVYFGERIREFRIYETVRVLFIMGTVLFCVIFGRFLIGNMLDYTCYKYISSGEMEDFEAQMQERFRILEESGDIVYLPAMNSEQGPLMHMPVMPDPESYTNRVTAMFYDKELVYEVPRTEEYYHRD